MSDKDGSGRLVTLQLFGHSFSAYTRKALIALDERGGLGARPEIGSSGRIRTENQPPTPADSNLPDPDLNGT